MTDNFDAETGDLISPDNIAAPFVITHEGVQPIAPEAFDPWRARPMHRRGTAVNEAIEKVQHETGLTVWKGQPEA